MSNKRLLLLTLLPFLLSCEKTDNGSSLSPSSSLEPTKEPVSDSALPLTYFEEGLKKRFEAENFGLGIDPGDKKEAHWNFDLSVEEDLPTFLNEEKAGAGEYRVSGRSDDFTILLANLSNKEKFATYLGARYIDVTLERKDGSSSPLSLTQGFSLSLGSVLDRPFGFYADLSKCAISRVILENSGLYSDIKERYYVDLSAAYKGLSFPLNEAKAASYLSDLFRQSASKRLEEGKGSLYNYPELGVYELTFGSDKAEIQKALEEHFAGINLDDYFADLKDFTVNFSFRFNKEKVLSLNLEGTLEFSNEKSPLSAIAYDLPLVFLESKDISCSLPEEYGDSSKWRSYPEP